MVPHKPGSIAVPNLGTPQPNVHGVVQHAAEPLISVHPQISFIASVNCQGLISKSCSKAKLMAAAKPSRALGFAGVLSPIRSFI